MDDLERNETSAGAAVTEVGGVVVVFSGPFHHFERSSAAVLGEPDRKTQKRRDGRAQTFALEIRTLATFKRHRPDGAPQSPGAEDGQDEEKAEHVDLGLGVHQYLFLAKPAVVAVTGLEKRQELVVELAVGTQGHVVLPGPRGVAIEVGDLAARFGNEHQARSGVPVAADAVGKRHLDAPLGQVRPGDDVAAEDPHVLDVSRQALQERDLGRGAAVVEQPVHLRVPRLPRPAGYDPDAACFGVFAQGAHVRSSAALGKGQGALERVGHDRDHRLALVHDRQSHDRSAELRVHVGGAVERVHVPDPGRVARRVSQLFVPDAVTRERLLDQAVGQLPDRGVDRGYGGVAVVRLEHGPQGVPVHGEHLAKQCSGLEAYALGGFQDLSGVFHRLLLITVQLMMSLTS